MSDVQIPQPNADAAEAPATPAAAAQGEAVLGYASPPAPARPSAAPAVTRRLLQPRFLAAVAILAVSAVGLNAAASFLQLHFRKQPVSLRVPSLRDESAGLAAELAPPLEPGGLTPVVGEMPRWVQVSRDEALTSEVEHVLATKEYVSRDYIDTRLINKLNNVAAFDNAKATTVPERLVVVRQVRTKPPEERAQFIAQVQATRPEAIVRMGVYYYTGLVDTVAHIPDRCYVADGFEPSSYDTLSGPNGALGAYPDGRPRAASFRFIHFEDVTGQGRQSRYVGYLFHCNGEYESDPLGVRARLQNLLEKYGYYAKVELMISARPIDPKDTKAVAGANDRAAQAMKDFLASALPDVERALPDWNQVKGRGK